MRTRGIAAAVGVVGVILAAVWLTRSGSTGGPALSSDPSAPVNFYDSRPVVARLAYGMTRQQVLRLDGPPAKTVRVKGLQCWQYPINEHVPASGRFKGYTLNAVGVCFFAGKFAIYHYKTDGKWDYNPNPPPL